MSNRSNRSAIFRLIALISLACLALVGASGSGPARAQAPTTETASASNILMLRLYYRDRAEYISLANEFGLEEAQSSRGYLLLPADQATLDTLLARGLRVEVDQAETDKINANPPIFGHNPETFWGGYHTVEEMEAFLDQRVAQSQPSRRRWTTATRGARPTPAPAPSPRLQRLRPLRPCVSPTRTSPAPSPCSGSTPASTPREMVPPEISMRYINWLLDGYNTNADARWLVDYHDIWIVPMSQPRRRITSSRTARASPGRSARTPTMTDGSVSSQCSAISSAPTSTATSPSSGAAAAAPAASLQSHLSRPVTPPPSRRRRPSPPSETS